MKRQHAMTYYVELVQDIDNIPNTTFSLGWDIDVLPEIGHIPSTTRLLYFGDFNKELRVGCIPNGVEYVEFGYYYNKKLRKGYLPDSITELTFGRCYSKIIEEDAVPPNCSHITCVNDNTLHSFIDICHRVRICLDPKYSLFSFSLDYIPYKVYIRSSVHNHKIIDGDIRGVYYDDVVEADGKEYLVVYGNKYRRILAYKSARK